ncbi:MULTISPECIES: hypothetical protein [Jeotgalicoccus]|uniref:hypothetical protein n=1 Tax=Jeotgalicoccus TaxID=227979 RepID=UPI000417C990|nr:MULTISPECIES: hypothetical protein [Jeotgalicoccus]
MNALKRREEILTKIKQKREKQKTDTFREKNKNKKYSIDFNKNIYDELLFRSREGDK